MPFLLHVYVFHSSAHLWNYLSINNSNAIQKKFDLTILIMALQLFLKAGFSCNLFPAVLPLVKEHWSAGDTWNICGR